jgi:molybdopterin synthase catalytic subunit
VTVRLVEIRDTPLSVDDVLGCLDESVDGGVTLFVGKVRDHDGGKAVTGLDYSAHPSALDRLREVCELVDSRHDVHGVAAIHRVGRLAIGDLAVVVGTAAAHRGTAFEATRDLIDTLKSEVPIWKHQAFVDGSDEWVGTP